VRRRRRRRKEAKARQRNRGTTPLSTGLPGSKAVWRRRSAEEAEGAEDHPGRPSRSPLDGGAATSSAAQEESASSEAAEVPGRRAIRPDPEPATLGGEARAGGGGSEAREGPTGAGGALGE
jgi:hypothetical protein